VWLDDSPLNETEETTALTRWLDELTAPASNR
jgi:hypothetical protein